MPEMLEVERRLAHVGPHHFAICGEWRAIGPMRVSECPACPPRCPSCGRVEGTQY
jgi:hypothetical protein